MNISISIVSLFCIVFTLLYFVCIFVCCILCVINDDDFPADFLPRTVCGKCLTQYVVTLTWQPVTHLQPWILWVDSNPKPCHVRDLHALINRPVATKFAKKTRHRLSVNSVFQPTPVQESCQRRTIFNTNFHNSSEPKLPVGTKNYSKRRDEFCGWPHTHTLCVRIVWLW